MYLREIAARIGGEVSGNGEIDITGIASIKNAGPGDITFLLSKTFEKDLAVSKASAFIVPDSIEKTVLAGRNAVLVKNPSLAYALTTELFCAPHGLMRGISPLAFVATPEKVSTTAVVSPFVYIAEDAIIDDDVVIYPFTFIGRGVRVGAGSTIYPNVSIYEGVSLGKGVIVHSGAVLGADGFGYTWDGAQHRKIVQLGVLEIEDNVEIGANTCIDRAALDKTIVGKGTKIDNLVQVGHNVTIGQHTILVSQVGIAGSTAIGNGVVLGGKVGVRDHVVIGDHVQAAGGAGITKDVKENSIIAGNPHMGHREWLRQQGYLRKLPDLFDRLHKIEEKLNLREKND